MFLLLAACSPSLDDTAVALGVDASEKAPPSTGFTVTHTVTGAFTSTCGFTGSQFSELAGYVTAGDVASSQEFLAAAQVLQAKLAANMGTPPSLNTVCVDLLGALGTSFREGDCPSYTGGAAVTTGPIPLSTAMNSVEDLHYPDLAGSWCHVALDPVTPAAADGKNLYWAHIYGFYNFSAAGVLNNAGNGSYALYGIKYFVPNAVSGLYYTFLNGSLGASYPPGSSFALSLQQLWHAKNTMAATTTLNLQSPSDIYGIIDPEVTDASVVPKDIYELDAFVAAQVESGGLTGRCSRASGFLQRAAPEVIDDPAFSEIGTESCR